MNSCRKLTLAALATTVLAVLTPNARAQMLEERERVTFSGPVEVPGEVLPAGSYVFEALENGHLTRILSADETHVYATLFTVPDEQRESVEKATIVLGEGPKGSPERVKEWFFPGDSTGNEFIFQKARSRKDLASITGASIRGTGRAVADTAKRVAISSEFVGVHAEHVVVNSSVAIAHSLKYLV